MCVIRTPRTNASISANWAPAQGRGQSRRRKRKPAIKDCLMPPPPDFQCQSLRVIPESTSEPGERRMWEDPQDQLVPSPAWVPAHRSTESRPVSLLGRGWLLQLGSLKVFKSLSWAGWGGRLVVLLLRKETLSPSQSWNFSLHIFWGCAFVWDVDSKRQD